MPSYPHAPERFEVIRSLGQGATGRVFEVEDRLRGGRYAAKRLRDDRSRDADRVARFKDEFRALERIAHTNLARVYELISDATGTYVVMELVDGVDFVQYVNPGIAPSAPVPTASGDDEESPPVSRRGVALHVGRLRASLAQLVSGLLALHAAGKVHCDIKSDNVLVTPDGRVVVLDFGLLSDAAHGQRRSGRRGTPAFMAPELFDGHATPAADWYAVGGLLYFACTGQLPFENPRQARTATPLDPRLFVRRVPDDLADLIVRLLRANPADRPTGAEVARIVGVSPPVASAPRFVGRGAELAQLREAFERTKRGSLQIVHVHGESGIGKTALVRQFAGALAAEGHTVFRGACYASASVPYRGLDSLVDGIAARVDPFETLTVDESLALVTMFPVFARPTRASAAELVLEPALLRTSAVSALRSLFARIGTSGPVALCIDDFQWTDEDSIDLLSDLLAPPCPANLLLLLSYRAAQDDGVSERMHHAHRAFPPDDEIVVRPLGPAALEELVLASDLTAGVCDRDAIMRESRGNPFFVGELVRACTAGHARDTLTLDRVLSARIGALPLGSPRRAYLELVSIAGRPLHEDVLAAALGLSRGAALEARHALVAGSFVRAAEAEGYVEAYHDRISGHVLRALSPEGAVARHEALARAYEAFPGVDSETLAIHYRAAGNTAKALQYMQLAADMAARALAFDHAADFYRAALAMARDVPRASKSLRSYAPGRAAGGVI